jgi:hypothetical protein
VAVGRHDPIDLVYTWVDGEDPALRADIERHARRPGDRNPERFRDRFELLRYSLRSVERHLPWIRNVVLFTRRPQVPRWLDRSHPRLRIVHHDELPGLAPYLPTFNSVVAESFVHELPGLSSHFLYCNDDFLFGAPTPRSEFVAPDGRIRLTGTFFGEWLPFRVRRGRWVLYGGGELEHVPRLFCRSWFEQMLARRPGAVDRTRRSRFRRSGDLRPDRMYRAFLLAPWRRHRVEVVPWRDLRRVHRFVRIENEVVELRDRLDELRRAAPRYYCLNDDQGPRPDPGAETLVRAFLQESFPAPSSFEVAP